MLMTALLAAASLQSDLQAIVDSVAKKYKCSVSLGIRMPNDVKYSAAGGFVSEGTYPVAAQTSDRYAWGSVTKTMTGAAIMKRVSSGELSLDGVAHPFVDAMLKSANYPYDMSGLFSADKWSIPPEHQYDPKKVTIEQLLHMVSGVPDYDTDAYRHLQYTHASTGFSPLDILDYVHAPLMFQPGGPVPSGGSHHSNFNYCSVNFILLGLVLAERTGASSWDAYDQGEILPLALRERVHFASLTDLCGNVTAPVHGYDRQSYATSQGKHPFDVSSINCLAGWTASRSSTSTNGGLTARAPLHTATSAIPTASPRSSPTFPPIRLAWRWRPTWSKANRCPPKPSASRSTACSTTSMAGSCRASASMPARPTMVVPASARSDLRTFAWCFCVCKAVGVPRCALQHPPRVYSFSQKR